jgi:nucleoside-diphosphate-sugar epimerase
MCAGHRVLALSRQHRLGSAGLEWVKGDLRDPDSYRPALRQFRASALVHLAWEGIPDYGEDVSRLNADVSVRLLNVAADEGCSALVAMGSCWEYAPTQGAVREDAPVDTRTPFATAKHRIRVAGEQVAQTGRARFTWLRPFFVYGPGQRADSLVPTVIARVTAGEPVVLRTPDAAHDFVFVDDVAAAIVSLVEQSSAVHGVYNVGTGRATRVRDIARIVAEVAGVDVGVCGPDVEQGPASGHGFWADLTRIRAATDWTPRFDALGGIQRTMAAMNNRTGTRL